MKVLLYSLHLNVHILRFCPDSKTNKIHLVQHKKTRPHESKGLLDSLHCNGDTALFESPEILLTDFRHDNLQCMLC